MGTRSETVGASWISLRTPETTVAVGIFAESINVQLDNDAVLGAKVQKLHSLG